MPRVNGAFNGAIARFVCAPGLTQIDIQALYSDWKDWVLSGAGAKFRPFFRVIGGEPTTGGKFAGRLFFLDNNFQIEPQAANHELQILGNVFTNDGRPIIVPLAGFTITAAVERSNLAEGIATAGGNPGGLTPAQIAEATYQALLEDLIRLRELHLLRGLGDSPVIAKPPTTTAAGYQRTGNNAIRQILTANGDERIIERE